MSIGIGFAIAVAGFALGLFVYRWVITMTIHRPPNTICDYCHYAHMKADKKKTAQVVESMIDELRFCGREDRRRIKRRKVLVLPNKTGGAALLALAVATVLWIAFLMITLGRGIGA